jgi:hypothetical protein
MKFPRVLEIIVPSAHNSADDGIRRADYSLTVPMRSLLL